MTNDPVTRGDLDSVWRAIGEIGKRVEVIDSVGTRGSSAVLIQIAEVIKDVSALQVQVEDFQRGHQDQHKSETAARVVSRRWAVATAVAFLAAIEGPLFYLIQAH